MAAADLSAQRLRQVLHYDPLTGEFMHLRKHLRDKQPGCGHRCTDGYTYLGVDNAHVLAHRAAWLYMTGAWPIDQVDHIDGDKANNRFLNLRDASRETNAQNLHRPRADNKSGFLGVHLHPAGKWVAMIRIAGKKKNLGYFTTPELAHVAYVQAKRMHHAGCTI